MVHPALLQPWFAMTVLFAILLLSSTVFKAWLATRQIRYVARHRGSVPPAFAERVGLEAHQKAADYTIAKARFGLVDLAWGTLLTLGWTLFGALGWLDQALLRWFAPGLTQELALLVAFTLAGTLLELSLIHI